MLIIKIFNSDAVSISKTDFIITAIITLAVYVGLYLLMSFALKRLAKNRGVEKVNIAFVPFARYYLLKYIIGDVIFFGKKTDKVWLFFITAVIIDVVFALLNGILGNFPFIYALSDVIFNGATHTIYITMNNGAVEMAVSGVSVSDTLNTISLVVNILAIPTSIYAIVVEARTFFAFFRKYSPFHAVIFTILSIFLGGPLFLFASIYFFAIRNRAPFDFAAFNGRVYETGAYGSGEQREEKREEPFGEFSNENKNKNDDPFDL